MTERKAQDDLPKTLDAFLESIQLRAYKTALISTSSQEDALDIVQDSMIKLAEKYADKTPQEWPKLFHRILQSKIRDWYRRQKVRNQWRTFFKPRDDDNEDDLVENAPDLLNSKPDDKFIQHLAMETLEAALQSLPLRQQQAFLLRTWEGLDVAETANAMECSQGSVKTHYSRAIHTLRAKLEDYQ